MTEVITTHTGEYHEASQVPVEVRDRILGMIANQPGRQFTDTVLLIDAIDQGWNYGLQLINGFKPEEGMVSEMARKICQLGQKAIDTESYMPVKIAIDASARAAKRTLPVAHIDTTTSEQSASDI